MTLEEMTRYDLLRGASPEPWRDPMSVRIQGYTLKYIDAAIDKDKREFIVKFQTSKAGHTTQFVYVSFDDFWDLYDSNNTAGDKLSAASLINLVLMHGKLKVFCTCPAWVYGGYKYMATQMDYALGSTELRSPKIRNPKLLGSVCKHAYVVLKALPYQKFGITASLNRYLKTLPQEPKETSDNVEDTDTEEEEEK